MNQFRGLAANWKTAFLRRRRSRDAWGNIAFWALVTAVVLFLLKLIPRFGQHISLSPWVATLVWIIASLPAFFHWMRWRLLWRLRNRLIVTYALIGVTPVVLFGLLAGIAAYVLFGQFANFAAASEINAELAQLAARNESLALYFQHVLLAHPTASKNGMVSLQSTAPPEASEIATMPELRIGVYLDGQLQPMDLAPGHALTNVASPPAWAGSNFSGLVLSDDHVYFRAITRELAGAHSVAVITSLPLDSTFLSRVASGLGRVSLLPKVQLSGNTDQTFNYGGPQGKSLNGSDFGTVTGGVLPKAANAFDIQTNFPTTLETVRWSTGAKVAVIALVTSRPSLLYQRLFRQSGVFGGGVRVVLITTAVVFACLELLAIFLASRLSRTITRSVSQLYHATREVDQGRLNYRIPVSRRDQLAALSGSFNTMSESLSRLLDEQKEKERLQSELVIAQEVQSNLFPSCDVHLGELELHGVCRPARTVSGDYYDFLVLGNDALFLAIGDISGKGISAALLMAGLHSAVRAYRFASEEVIASGALGTFHSGHNYSAPAEMFRSPGNLMRLLNLHLYRSTQPEKYATLFLAHYEASDCTLRYSNGGQLPPLILRADGSILRLDRGGTVIGLLDNMEYEEGAVVMKPGDMLIAYSDGVTEPENEFGDFGETRMVELVRRNGHLPLQEISDRVLQAIQDWIGADEQPDDITMVLARQR
jgi:phosphoserine phosphatase RsbU/P